MHILCVRCYSYCTLMYKINFYALVECSLNKLWTTTPSSLWKVNSLSWKWASLKYWYLNLHSRLLQINKQKKLFKPRFCHVSIALIQIFQNLNSFHYQRFVHDDWGMVKWMWRNNPEEVRWQCWWPTGVEHLMANAAVQNNAMWKITFSPFPCYEFLRWSTSRRHQWNISTVLCKNQDNTSISAHDKFLSGGIT